MRIRAVENPFEEKAYFGSLRIAIILWDEYRTAEPGGEK
jgi:hypothetical protein